MMYLFGILIFLSSLFLILLILIQRGRGGGLAGAFGGMGGQSAFGTKAGDLFTRVTIVVAAVWIVLSVGAIKVLNQSQSVFGNSAGKSAFSRDESDKAKSTEGTDKKDKADESISPAGSGTSLSGGKSETAPPPADSKASSGTPSSGTPSSGTSSSGTSAPPPATNTTSDKPPAESPDEGKK